MWVCLERKQKEIPFALENTPCTSPSGFHALVGGLSSHRSTLKTPRRTCEHLHLHPFICKHIFCVCTDCSEISCLDCSSAATVLAGLIKVCTMAADPGFILLVTPLILLLCSSVQLIQIPKDLTVPPTITEHSNETYVVYPNDDILLKCEGTGDPALMFRWTKDDEFFDPSKDHRIFTTPGSGTLSIPNTNGLMVKSFQGTWRCYASNKFGTAISSNIHLVAESTPKWQKEVIRPMTVEEGESVVLHCNPPNSTMSRRIIWMNSTLFHIVQDQRVSMGLNGNLYFANVLSQDSHPDYTCHAQFMAARTIILKEPIELRVKPTNSVKYRKPRFLMPPGSNSIYYALRGTVLHLECITEGLPTPDIEWVRLNGMMPLARVSYENFKKILRISDVMEEDDGEYQCMAKNTQGSVKHNYRVNVKAAPYWVKKPENNMYVPGETARLDCKVYGNPIPNITWRINGVPMKDLDPDPKRQIKDGTLKLISLQTEDTAVVQCEASNQHGTLLANAYVYVTKLPPQILTQDNMQYEAVEQMTVCMNCYAFGSPFPTIEWMRDQWTPVLEDDRYNVLTNGTLCITNAQKEYSGLYTCIATNDQDNATINAILDVKNATKILVPPKDTRVRIGDSAVFQCNVLFDSSFQESSMSWKKDGMEIQESDDSSKYFIEDSNLTISSVDNTDQGMYTCMAWTQLDSVEKSAVLIVVDRPGAPYDLELSDQQDHSVTLTWTPGNDNNSPIEDFIIEFEEDKFEPGTWHELTSVDGITHLAQLQLSPYVNYQFRVVAVNEFGRSEASPGSERFQTAEAAPERNPGWVKGEGTNPDNMIISWENMKGLDWNGHGFRYLVKWRLQGQAGEWHKKEVGQPPVIVQNTDIFVPYEIRVQALNDIGEGPEPKTIIGYSGEALPDMAPENVGIEVLNRSAIKVTWSPVPKKHIRGHLGGYKIYYEMEHRIGIHGKQELRSRRHIKHHVFIVRGDQHHATIQGLEPFSHYSLRVLVFNGKGEGPPSPAKPFQTPEGVPGEPAFLNLKLVSDTSLSLLWDVPRKPNGHITGYFLQYQPVNKTHAGVLTNINISDPHQRRWTLQDLDPKALYKFYLRALTAAGEGVPLIIEGSTVQEAEFPPVLNITFHSDDNSTLIQWTPREGQRSVEVQVRYLKKNRIAEDWQVSGSVNSTQNFYRLLKLEPGTNYRIQLMAWNHTDFMTFWEDEVTVRGIALPNNQGSFATEGWFIGLISAIVLLILILLILCFIKRSKGGKYSVKDKEDTQVDSEARPMKDETFGEYSDNEEKPFGGGDSSQPSLNGEIKPLGSDDSLADYGGSVDVQFNEDGSFIGQYSGKKEGGAGGNESSGAASPVNNTVVGALE
uniref:Neural cell adhesion molecule L1 n=1 Tax=Geotrypetes seraphini TaxID=260995 RepID=A0A6P8PM37_GEOSA|nr:neural cell adhesion molecule L1 isoform X2 [Geotrypetes seraphini]